ncbi:sugar phosphate isomerase/epimerase family protein [Paenibacillus solisilvae]|uniref:Sugar phosphate isomerase/epimerase family protein n=1 Tax=Paenibacillus solisilvae TaxID=2486751 RepID=A0ABW0VTM8_9BACL
MYTYSATQWIFGNEDIETSLIRLKKYGYDGVELAGEPYKMDLERIIELLHQYEMVCTSICGIYTPERDLSSSDPAVRGNAIQYVKDCVDMAERLGAKLVIVVPAPVGKTAPDPQSSAAAEWSNAVNSLQEAGQYAAAKPVKLAIEALNRFETYLVNNLTTARRLVEEVKVKSVQIMADLFHMNIEERNHTEALRMIAPYLIHVHIADNTREAAGLGQTDFEPIMKTLAEIGYEGSITMEFLPPVSNPYLAASSDGAAEIFDDYTERSIREIKRVLTRIG